MNKQTEEILEIDILWKKTGITDVSITNRIQEKGQKISGLEDTIGEIAISVREIMNVKSKCS